MTGRLHDVTSELPKKKVSAAEAAFGQAFGARPFDSAPMQQIVRPQMKRALERMIRRVLHHPAGNEAKHHPRYDFALIAREE